VLLWITEIKKTEITITTRIITTIITKIITITVDSFCKRGDFIISFLIKQIVVLS